MGPIYDFADYRVVNQIYIFSDLLLWNTVKQEDVRLTLPAEMWSYSSRQVSAVFFLCWGVRWCLWWCPHLLALRQGIWVKTCWFICVLSWGHTTQLSQSLPTLKRLRLHTNSLVSADSCMTETLGIKHFTAAPAEGSQASWFVRLTKANWTHQALARATVQRVNKHTTRWRCIHFLRVNTTTKL